MTAPPNPPQSEPGPPPREPDPWPPPSWELPPLGGHASGSAEGEQPEHRCLELCPICRAADVLRATGSPELRGQLDDVGREALLTLRSLVDHYLERLEQRERGADRVEHIPID